MNAKSVVKWVLLAFVVVCVGVLAFRSFRGSEPVASPVASPTVAPSAEGEMAVATAAEASSKDRVVALYLYSRVRCASCVAIEKLSMKAIEGGFAADLSSGRLALLKANMDLPENERLITDFQLANRTLLLIEYRGGKPVRFEKLDQVWNLYQDEKAFLAYVDGKVKSFLSEAPTVH